MPYFAVLVFYYFHDSTNLVARGIMFPECSGIYVCMSFEQTLLARYLGYLLMEFDQTFYH